MRHKATEPSGELAILREIRQRTARSHAGNGSRALRLGIGDDCALLRPRAGEELAVTTDLSLEGRHFLLDTHPPEAIGHRCIARGLSDLAAMGARPVAVFLSLALPPELSVTQRGKSWLSRFYDGLLALAEAHQAPLAGGDLAQFSQVVADITLIGAVPRGRALVRSGARPGDLLYVTGTLGGSAAGLRILAEIAPLQPRMQAKIPAALAERLRPHLYPQPRIAQGLWLQRRGVATAALDLSDGLSTDLAHLCEESCVAAEIDAAALPIHIGATLEEALHGGEDYELLFTAAPSAKLPRSIVGVPITKIGRITSQKAGHKKAGRPQVNLLTASGPVALQPRGWQHFSTQS
jgi:thiamine-monophosphate kinase